MKGFACSLLALLFFTLFLTGHAWTQVDTLVILNLSDTHSHLLPYGPEDSEGKGKRGGLARTAKIINQIKSEEKNVLMVHAGDVFTGDLMSNKYHIVPQLQFFQKIGFDVLTIGNHEFDRTPETLKRAFREAGFPIPGFELLSANLDMTEEPELAALVKPFTIKQIGNLKIGLFGLTIERTTNSFSYPAPVVATDYLAAGQAAVDSLRPKCDLVIGVTHLGYEQDSTLALNVAGIDIITGGHDHRAHFTPRTITNPEGKTTYIVRAGCFYNYLGYTKLAYNVDTFDILDYKLIPIDSTVAEDPIAKATVDSLVDSLQADPRYGPVYDEIIAEAAFDIDETVGARYKDSSLGNLVTDAFRLATDTDIAIQVAGNLRQPIYKGQLTGAEIFQAISTGYDEETGYGHNIVKFKLMGADLKFGMAFTAIECQTDGDLCVQASGLELTYDSRFPSLVFIVKSFKIGGQPYKLDSLYTITTSSGVADFLSFAGLIPIDLEETGLTEYQVVRDFIIDNSPLEYYSEGRIQDISKTSVENSPAKSVARSFRLNQNYPNPFSATNARTHINYYLPEPDNQAGHQVAIKIYNILGEEVATLIDKVQPFGSYQVSWDGKNVNGLKVPSGIYFCRLTTSGTVLTRKMILLH
ncbi:5'-nucleotidase C-terminal domain-containing protein [candidate division KSB1 bacterium]|nr:5'-nucleotidase C-terminal domain-containing protein [candidate division KSB1 bacterium]